MEILMIFEKICQEWLGSKSYAIASPNSIETFFAGFEIFEFNTYNTAQQYRQLCQDGA